MWFVVVLCRICKGQSANDQADVRDTAGKAAIAKELGVKSAKKLVKATVSGLFGQYEHSIDFQKSNNFVIIYGPNGVGKTKFIEIIHASQSLNHFLLQSMPFSSAELKYSDGTYLMVTRNELNSDTNGLREYAAELEFQLIDCGGEAVKWIPFPPDFYEFLSQTPYFVPLGNGEWEDVRRREKCKLDELYRRYRRGRRPLRRSDSEFDDYADDLEYPAAFKQFSEQVSSYFIDSQRLLSENYYAARVDSSAEFVRGKRMTLQARINEYSERLKGKLNKAQTEHSRLSQEKDRSFPSRVLKAVEEGVSPDPATIRAGYKEQSEFRDRLAKVVSVDLSERLELPEGELKNWALALLYLYVKDTKEKFQPFANLLERIELLQEIVNKRLLNKRLEVTASDGMVVSRDDGERIALDSLSTGEQHEIILMFDLLLNVENGATVLIDEPEISLHVAWQLSFIPDVRKIADLVGFRFLVATHSPYIINDEWDRAVDLGSDEDLSHA